MPDGGSVVKTYSGYLKTSRLRRKTHVHWRRAAWRNRASPGHSAIIGSDIKTLCAHGNEGRASSVVRDYVIQKESSDEQDRGGSNKVFVMRVAASWGCRARCCRDSAEEGIHHGYMNRTYHRDDTHYRDGGRVNRSHHSDRPARPVGGVMSGFVVAIGTLMLLGATGLAVGTAAIGDPRAATDETAAGLGMGAGIWVFITLLVSVFLGGMVSTKVTDRPDRPGAVIYSQSAGVSQRRCSWPWRSGAGCGDRWASCSLLHSPSASECSANISRSWASSGC
jgi:hypothetical protein